MFTREDVGKMEESNDPKDFNAMMDMVPLRVIDIHPELSYYTKKSPSMSDHIEFLQKIINNSRIVLKSRKTLKIAEALFKQGFLFRHQDKAIEHNATRYSRTEEKILEERKKISQCEHGSCEH